jgi:hypothetical protein
VWNGLCYFGQKLQEVAHVSLFSLPGDRSWDPVETPHQPGSLSSTFDDCDGHAVSNMVGLSC